MSGPLGPSQITVSGATADGQALSADAPLLVAGTDGTNVRKILTDSSGRLIVGGVAASGAALGGNPVLIGVRNGGNAQVVSGNGAGQLFVANEGQKATYTACFLNFTPVATPTDIFAIFGSGSKTIRILKLWVTGLATAATIVDLIVRLRLSANSGSTPVALNVVQNDQNDSAATAAPVTYTVTNPTVGTNGNDLDYAKLFLGPASSSPVLPMRYEFAPARDGGRQVILRSSTQGLVLNWNGAAVPAGTVLNGGVLWTEE